MQSNLAAISNELENTVANAAPYVVAVHGRARGGSSGVLWRNGVVVTAEHTLQRDEDIRVILADGGTVNATIAGRDPGTDLAVLRIAGDAAPISTVSGERPLPGGIVLSLGRSKDSGINASMGIVSAASGEWKPWSGGRLDAYLRLDLTLFPGSAGGPVITHSGRCIGIASPVLSRIAPLAIPSATVERVLGELLSKGRIARGYLGVGVQPVRLPDHLNLKRKQTTALIVLSVEPGTPAERAGIVIGDVLLSIGDTQLEDPGDLQSALDSRSVGQPAELSVIRGGKAVQLTAEIVERGA